jgi:hypothetical protein
MVKLKAMKKWLILFISLLILFLTDKPCQAIVDPTTVPNNRIGIHIVSAADLVNAAQMINGNGGQWGYVSMVIRQDERNTDQWRAVFNQMNRLKLIPIIRIATSVDKQNWVKPNPEDADIWASFLDSLPWPVKNRYVVIFNEPNHASEWGGQIEPQEYANILKTYTQVLKTKNEDFFVLPAGLDASARNINGETMDEVKYLTQMLKAVPEVFDAIDGWASHSYPQPNFQGSVIATGRGSVRTFDWEIAQLKKLNINRNLPIFITETGWRKNGYTEKQLNYFYTTAFNQIWNRNDIIAVTPFLLNYQEQPFLDFSWQQPNSTDFFPQYYTVENIPKTIGKPVQNHGVSFLNSLPNELVADSNYVIDLQIKNTGQSIIDPADGFKLIIQSVSGLEVKELSFDPIMPGDTDSIQLQLHTGAYPLDNKIRYWLNKDNQVVGDKQEVNVKVFVFPDLHFTMTVGLNDKTSDRWFKITLYEIPNNFDENKPLADQHGQIVNEYTGSTTDQSQLLQIHNIIFGRRYVAQLTVYNSLPKDVIWEPHPGLNIVDFGQVWPIDLNNNGYFDLGDIWSLIKQPLLAKQFL